MSSLDPLLQIMLLGVGGLATLFCTIQLNAKNIFYLYFGVLFYERYLKIMFPGLPIGFLPDLILFLFFLRVFFLERGRLSFIMAHPVTKRWNFFLIFYLVLNLFTVFNPLLPSPLLGLQVFRVLFKIVSAYWACLIILESTSDVLRFIRFLALNIMVVFIFSFKQIFFGFTNYELEVYNPGPIRRVYSLMANAAVFSVVMGVGAIYWYLEGVYKQRPSRFLLCFFYLLVSSLSLHRAPLFATFFAIAFITLMHLKEFGNWVSAYFVKFFSIVLVSIIFLGMFSFVPLSGKLSKIRAEIGFRFEQVFQGRHEKSLKTRFDQIPPVLNSLKRYPFGGGLGYTQLRFGKSLDEFSVFKGLNNANIRAKLPMGTGDNTFLTVALEGGWGLLIFFLSLLFGAFFSISKKIWILRTGGEAKYIFSFAAATMIVLIFSIMTSSIYFTLIVGTFFWMSLALAHIAWREKESSV